LFRHHQSSSAEWQSEEPRKNSLRNLAYTAAAVIGLTAAAPSIIKYGSEVLGGRAGKAILSAIGADAEELIASSRYLQEGSVESASLRQIKLSDAANAAIEGLGNIQTAVFSQFNQNKQRQVFTRTLAERLQQSVVDSNGKGASAKAAEDWAERISHNMTSILQDTNSTQAFERATSASNLTGVQKIVGQSFDAENDIRVALDAAFKSPGAGRNDYATLIKTGDSAGSIIEAHREMVKAAARDDAVIKTFTAVDGREYRFKDLFNIGGENETKFLSSKGEDFDDFLTEEGRKVQQSIASETKGRNNGFLTDTLKEYHKNLTMALSESGAEAADGDLVRMQKNLSIFLETKTGLVNTGGKQQTGFIGKILEDTKKTLDSGYSRSNRANREIVSQAQIANAIRFQAAKGGQEMTIPLLPGVFNVNVSKLFNFLKSDPIRVKKLGELSLQPDLGKGAKGMGIGIGRKLFSLQTDGKNATFKAVNTDKSYRFLATSESKATRDALSARNKYRSKADPSVINFLDLDEIAEVGKGGGSNVVKAVRKFFLSDEDQATKARDLFYSMQHELYDVSESSTSSTSAILIPKKGVTEGLAAALLKKFSNNGEVSMDDLTELTFNLASSSKVHASTRFQALEHASNLAGSVPFNYSDDLAKIASKVGVINNSDSNYYMPGLLEVISANDADATWVAMDRMGWLNPSESLEGIIKLDSGLHRTLEYTKKDRLGFGAPGSSTEGFKHSTHEGFFGSKTGSKLYRDAQDAELDQLLTMRGESLVGGGEAFETFIKDSTKTGVTEIDSLLLQMAGITDGELGTQTKFLEKIYQNMTIGVADDKKVDRAAAKELLSMLGGWDLLNDRSLDITDETRAKIASNFIKSLKGLRGSTASATSNFENLLVERASDALQLGSARKVVDKRFGFLGKSRTPAIRDYSSVTSDLDYYAVQTLKDSSQIHNWLGASLQALVDPNASQTDLGHAAMSLVTTSNKLAEPLGLALGSQDLLTVPRYAAALTLKRLLPAYIGYELYNNINDDAETYGVPGLDDLSANIRAKLTIGIKKLGDLVGANEGTKDLVRAFPGLEKYITARTAEEYQEYLMTGYDAIKRGRFLVLGNKGDAAGSDVEYWRANYYRRAHSNWTSADNVQHASAETSFLPTLTNPLAPIARLLGPSWEERVKKDRPYRPDFSNNPKDAKSQALVGAENVVRTTAANYSNLKAYYGGGRNSSVYGDIENQALSAAGLEIAYGAEAGYGRGNGGLLGSETGKVEVYLNKPIRPSALRSSDSLVFDIIDKYRDQSGLYGGLLKALTGGMSPNYYDIPNQSSSDARDIRRYIYANKLGELSGEGGEFFRRVLGFPDKNYDAFSPYKNSMPSWLVAADEALGWGDPYTRGENYEQLLPGDAFERLNQYTRPNKVDISMLGRNEAEVIESMINPIGYYDSKIFEGEKAKMAQMEALSILQRQGALAGTNVPVYNEEMNYSGTVDAVMGGATKSVVKIVPLDSENFANQNAGYSVEEAIQLEMKALGVQRGVIAYINQDDPSQIRTRMVGLEQGKIRSAMSRIYQARETLEQLREIGALSPYETYDPLSRLQVLSRVKPNSRETRELESYFETKTTLGGHERIIFQQIKRDLDLMRRDYTLHTPLSSTNIRNVHAVVQYVTGEGHIVTKAGTYKVAGIEWESELVESGTIQEVLAHYGIKAGKVATFRTNANALDPELMGQQVFSADFGVINTPLQQIGRLSNRLVEKGYAREYQSGDPTDRVAFDRSLSPLAKLWEWGIHSDNMISNKFMRNRSPSEQLSRGDVYGSDYMSWSDLPNTLVAPTISNWASKAPLQAAVSAGVVGYIAFGVSKKGKGTSALLFASLAATAASIRGTYELATGKKWKPGATRRRDKFEDYWDALQYLKFSRLAEFYKDQAWRYEGTNVDLLSKSPYRLKKKAGKWSMLAIDAENKAKRTRMGFNVINGTVDQMIASISQPRRQAVKEALLYGNDNEKQKVFELLSPTEKRVTARYFGKSTPNIGLDEIFSKAYLPDEKWGGWSPDVDINDLKTRSRLAEGIQGRPIGKREIRQARSASQGVPLPNLDRVNRMPLSTKPKIDRILAGTGITTKDIQVMIDNKTAPTSNIDVSVNMKQDDTSGLESYMKDRAY